MGKLKTDQNGFSAVEAVLILVVLGLVGFVAWRLYSHRATNTNSAKSTTAVTQKRNYLSQDQMVSQLAKQLPTQFTYLDTPQVQDAELVTNLFGNNTWWVSVKSPNTALTVDFQGPSTGVFANLPNTQQASYTAQAQAVVNSIGSTLTKNGYVRKAPPIHMSAGVGFISDSGDASGYYKGTVGNCTLLRWDTLPLHIELHCAPAALVQAAVSEAAPFVKPFSTTDPSRLLNTVDVQSIALKQTAANRYALVTIDSPDGIDTHPTDGPNFFVSTGSTWRYLSSAALCNDPSKVSESLKTAGAKNDANAAAIIDSFCASLGP